MVDVNDKCTNVDDLPEIDFVIDKVHYTLTPKEYTMQMFDNGVESPLSEASVSSFIETGTRLTLSQGHRTVSVRLCPSISLTHRDLPGFLGTSSWPSITAFTIAIPTWLALLRRDTDTFKNEFIND
jgi:hypothetical protein